MDRGFDSTLVQIFLQFVAAICLDDEYVERIEFAVATRWDENRGITEEMSVPPGMATTPLNDCANSAQAQPKQLSLQYIHPGYRAPKLDGVTIDQSMVSQQTHLARYGGIIRSDKPGVTSGVEVLQGMSGKARYGSKASA
jgi:hypothetical protein